MMINVIFFFFSSEHLFLFSVVKLNQDSKYLHILVHRDTKAFNGEKK